MAASRTRGNVTLAVGYRSMNAVVEGVGYLAPEPHTAVRRYEVRSTTFEERLHEMQTMQTPPHHTQCFAHSLFDVKTARSESIWH
jgi:hypothetical protein